MGNDARFQKFRLGGLDSRISGWTVESNPKVSRTGLGPITTSFCGALCCDFRHLFNRPDYPGLTLSDSCGSGVCL